uniref:non-specific serine/threonine protein kinase n=1 Tax=Enterobius vermicularis TaxID=51028 RepID=A0A0N4VFU5_ENTVE
LQKVGLYDICKAIGKGNFAIVRLARHRIAKCKVAIKIVDKHRIDQENLMKVEREIRVLKTLDHPHIIKLYEIIRTEQYIYIVTEFARNGELFVVCNFSIFYYILPYNITSNLFYQISEKVLAARGKLPEAESRRYFQQVVSAIAYCHHRGIVHRDIKAENILLDKNDEVKLIGIILSISHSCGSHFMYDGTKADIWSLGVVLFIMVTGGFPFAGENVDKLKNAVVAGQLKIPFWVAPDCCDLLRKMIVVYPERRINIDCVAQHRWVVAEMSKKLRQLIREKPVDRLLPDTSSFKLDNIISYYMHRCGNWSEGQIAEEVTKKNFESPIYATYELFRTKLDEKTESNEPLEVPPQPRRGSRGSITTGKANIDDEPPAPTISARSLVLLGLSDSSDEELDKDSEKDDLSLSPAESWLCHAAQLGPVAGMEEPSTSLNRSEARRHTLVGTSELGNLFAVQQVLSVFLEKGSFAAAVLAANQAAAVAYASRVANPFLDQSPNMLLQDSLALYNKILTLPSSERRASAGNSISYTSSEMSSQLPDRAFNASYNIGGLLSLNPNRPSTSGTSAAAAAAVANSNVALQTLHPGGLGNLSFLYQQFDILCADFHLRYLKRFGHSKRNTFHSLSGSSGNSTGLTSARRGPYTRQPASHERRSSWTSVLLNLSGQQQTQLERLYKQSVGTGDQVATNIQQLQKEFKELNASFQTPVHHSSLETQQQRNCPPLISITDENDCVQMPMPISFFSRNNEKVQGQQPILNITNASEGADAGSSLHGPMKLMPPSENSVLISFLETDIVLQHLRSALDNLAIAYRETACVISSSAYVFGFLENHRICVENGEKSRIEIDVIPVPFSISQAKSRVSCFKFQMLVSLS